MDHPERQLLISVETERYGGRSNLEQFEAQRAFQWLLRAATDAAGLERLAWKTQQAGDAELAVVPAGTSEPLVVDRFVPELGRRLRQYNRGRVEAARVRVRVALHQGLVRLDGENGFPGTAVSYVSRLREVEPLRRAFAVAPDAELAVIVSAECYRELMLGCPGWAAPGRFRQVEVRHVGDRPETAWICVVGGEHPATPEQLPR